MSWLRSGGAVLAAPLAEVLAGRQEPVYQTVPPYVSTSGDEVADLMAMTGTKLDEWQRLVLRHGLGEKPDGGWAAFEVAMILARQLPRTARTSCLRRASSVACSCCRRS